MANVNIYEMAQTWNNGATVFTAIEMDVTDTDSDAASLLTDLKVGGTSQFSVSKAGVVKSSKVDSGTAAFGNTAGTAGLSFYAAGNRGALVADGQVAMFWGNSTTIIPNGRSFEFEAAASGVGDLVLERDAADTLALRRTTNAQTFNIYSTWASSTDYHRAAFATAKVTLSSVSGATVTASSLIPDGAVVIGVTTKVTTGLGTGSGTSGYTVGPASGDDDRWGSVSATAAGTSTDNRDWTATTIQAFTSAEDVKLTALGGNFDGTGVIDVSVQYLIGQVD